MKLPGPDHPITIEPNPHRVRVRFGDRVIAETTRALTLREANLPPVHYIPLEDVDSASVQRTSHQTHCPYKGNASYYTIQVDGHQAGNAVWTYEHPFPAVAPIAGHLAFYADRVDTIEESPA